MKYLIVKCEELDDQWECDANRKPITMTDNWQEWYIDNIPDYYFEVYEYNEKENTFSCIKNYDVPVENGMCFAYYPNSNDDTPTGLRYFPSLTRYDAVPTDIMERALQGDDFDDWLKNCGYISWYEDDILYCYTEYEDNKIYNCF